jgi:hypothetical protein
LCNNDQIWKLLNLKILSAAISIKSLLLAAFSDRATMRGSRMALKIFLSPSMAMKWQPTLRQAWTKALVEKQGRCKQKSHKKQSQGHLRKDNKKLRTCGCNAIKNYVANLCGRLNEQLKKERVLLPTTSPRSATS